MADGDDKVRFGPEVAPGVRSAVRHRADHQLESAVVFQAREGRPIPEGAELIHIEGRGEDGWHKVAGSFKNETAKAAGDGPAQVATEAYRRGYDQIFGKRPVGLA